jgi:hypothetical protein
MLNKNRGSTMTAQEQITQVAASLSEPQLGQLLNFALYLRLQEETNEWRLAGRHHFAKAYGDDEPAYTEADIKKWGAS